MTAEPIAAERIDESLVRALLREQFPPWAQLPLRRVEPGGNDHRIFRLGDDRSVRLPSAPGYVPQVRKEQVWLPRLAGGVPLPIPEVLGAGRPTPTFPAPWSIYGWMEGEPASRGGVADWAEFASDLARFLVGLRTVDPTGGPSPGLHSAFRGGPISHWDDEVRDLMPRVEGRERDLADGIWRDALAATFTGRSIWFHGDVSLHNLLLRHGRLAAVIDFGCSGVGDPACDTVFRWTAPSRPARVQFAKDYAADEGTWARGRGWALWKALIMLSNKPPEQARFARHVLDLLFDEP
jgi:aminoglycoside phosphotransferase (APT) family kinase protein